MRLCVFADIHGNGPAFAAALPRLRAEAADACVFLGDLCGYYFDQEEVRQGLASLPGLLALLGNHDAMFLRMHDGDAALRRDYAGRYGLSAERLLERDCAALAGWLRGLAPQGWLAEAGALCCHGSPADPLDGRIYPDTPLTGLDAGDARFLLLGHTHYRILRRMGDCTVLNPGSLGQPRDGGRPSYAVLDTDSGHVEFRDVDYDRAALIRSIERAGDPNPYLRSVLERVRTGEGGQA